VLGRGKFRELTSEELKELRDRQEPD